MEELAFRVRTFVYTMICFQCLIQLTAGNPFHKYLKLFSQLLAISICCNIVFSFLGMVGSGWEQAEVICERWQAQWNEEQQIESMDGYLEKHIMEMSISEFETQIDELLKREGEEKYQLKEIERDEEGKWNIVIESEQGEGEGNFAVEFKEDICRRFSIQEEQVEVKVQ